MLLDGQHCSGPLHKPARNLQVRGAVGGLGEDFRSSRHRRFVTVSDLHSRGRERVGGRPLSIPGILRGVDSEAGTVSRAMPPLGHSLDRPVRLGGVRPAQHLLDEDPSHSGRESGCIPQRLGQVDVRLPVSFTMYSNSSESVQQAPCLRGPGDSRGSFLVGTTVVRRTQGMVSVSFPSGRPLSDYSHSRLSPDHLATPRLGFFACSLLSHVVGGGDCGHAGRSPSFINSSVSGSLTCFSTLPRGERTPPSD